MDSNLHHRNLEHVLWCTGHQLLISNIIRAEGCYLYDKDGKKYMDLESGVWVTPLGHNHPTVNKAIKDQLDKVTHTGYCYSSEIVELSSRAVLDACGFKQGKCVFLSSGSEAVEFGLQVLRSLSGKNKLCVFMTHFWVPTVPPIKRILMNGISSIGVNVRYAKRQETVILTVTS